MIFKNEHKRSLFQKLFFMTALFLVITISGLMMFTDMKYFSTSMESFEVSGDIGHRIILIACLIVYYVRLMFTVFVFLKRSLGWSETLIISFLMSMALLGLARSGGSFEHPVGLIEFSGIILYISGSILNTQSEYTRYIWKKDPKNNGRLYTGGLFRYSMHMNYFGDCLLFIGFALVAHSFTLLAIPLFMTLSFLFFIIPRLDKYLEEKYGEAFREYAKHTKKLVPFVY